MPNTGARNFRAGSTSSIKGVLVDLLTPTISNIIREPAREALIDIHFIISSNAESSVSDLGGGRHDHLASTMSLDYYLNHMEHTFIPPPNPGD